MQKEPDSSTGTLLREARKASRLSQTEVARRANIAQSVISAYESDQREPSMATFQRLVEATGHRLVISLDRDPSVRFGLPDTRLGRRIRQHRKALLTCAARRGATNVRVFGSVARGEERPDSDVDFVVDVSDKTGLFTLASLEREFSNILGVHVDLAASSELRPRIKDEVERDAVSL
jgi:predicted nucleotidyltransferase/DNA-binding XRE family transcriptional regulator